MFRELEILTLTRRGLSMLGLVAVLFVFSSPNAVAEEVSAEVKAKAQLTLAQWLKDRSEYQEVLYLTDGLATSPRHTFNRRLTWVLPKGVNGDHLQGDKVRL